MILIKLLIGLMDLVNLAYGFVLLITFSPFANLVAATREAVRGIVDV